MNAGQGDPSRLPNEDEYWEDLTARIERAAAPLLVGAGRSARLWWTRPNRVPALAAAALAAVAGAWLFLPERGEMPVGATFTGATLAPGDPLAAAVLRTSAPPSIEGLLDLSYREDR